MALLILPNVSYSQVSCNIELRNSSQYAPALKHVFGFFDENAFDKDIGVYWSEVNNQGQVVSQKVYNVALSRMIYGLSFANQLHPDYLKRATSLAQFQLQHLTSKRKTLTFFHSNLDLSETESPLKTPDNLDIWQQSYGLNGLSELYRHTREPKLLRQIHQLHDDFVARFHDKKQGGFWSAVNLTGNSNSNQKSLQSLMYPLTAYMLNLWQADQLNAHKYEPYILQNIQLAYLHGWNEHTNWVNVNFDSNWQSHKGSSSTPNIMPGHNFQLAALLFRGAELPFISAAQSNLWRSKAHQIIDATMAKPIFDGVDKNSFYRTVNPTTNQILDHRKSWWQHTEAIIALSLDKRFDYNLEKLTTFFFKNFIDWSEGGEFFYLDKNNKPITSELKGSIGKATYHTSEMTRYLTANRCIDLTLEPNKVGKKQ